MNTVISSFEKPLATEKNDIDDIKRGILAVQARFAAQQKRPLGRGTHTKGVCVRGTFEVFDIRSTVQDPMIAGRLARGVFARPGRYPALIRFANAASRINPDSKRDVRAMSFSLDIPAGVVGPNAFRQDFSLNNAPVFPINDAHAFAALIRVTAAGGPLAQARQFLSLPWADKLSVARTAAVGARQLGRPRRPYQQMRYWSNVPFLHGADEAVKYSAIPGIHNPGNPVATDANGLRDELARHLIEDPQMAYFDFGLQLLEADRMTHRGERREPSFWVENASVLWDEADSPFHLVARLTLEAGSMLPLADGDVMYIDVTEHSLPDCRPIGSINRARWAAESGSRAARFAAAPPLSAPAATEPQPGRLTALRRAIAGITVGTITRTVLAVAALGVLTLTGAIAYLASGPTLPREPTLAVVYADQGWGAGVLAPARQTYYYTAQGAGLKDLRYNWFVNLELPFSRRRLADPDILRGYGFLVDGPSPKNPDGLPVGFSRHFDQQLQEELLDISCAACHTGELHVRSASGAITPIRIDGGSALHAFTDSKPGHFVPMLMASMTSTVSNPFKFRRFAQRVLGEHTFSESVTLHSEMRQVIAALAAMGFRERRYGLVPTEEGYGRTDALARIANTVFADHIDSRNYDVGDAPVNYPPVWNIWKFDWVQYNASVSQPMARNIGETMGTGAKYTLVNRYGGPIPAAARYRSSAIVPNLYTIEVTLRQLKPPAWPADLLGPIDRAKAERGRQLFNERCVHCHGPFVAPAAMKLRNAPLKSQSEPEWIVRTICVDDIGTDPNTAMNFAGATVDLTKSGLTAADLRDVATPGLTTWKERQSVYLTSEIARLRSAMASAAGPADADKLRAELAIDERDLAGLEASMQEQLSSIDPTRLPVGLGLSYLGTLIRQRAYRDAGIPPEQQQVLDGFGAIDRPQVVAAYKPRPLAGIWAAPPYLHNGSVPTVYDLLSPVAERPKTFRVGSRLYDPIRLGLAQADDRYWTFDTSLDGNHNTGHEFIGTDSAGGEAQNGRVGAYLTPDERLAIIEHLKARNDDTDGPSTPRVPPWKACPLPPPRAPRQ